MAGKKKRKAQPGDVATNRQASYRFELLDKIEAGVVLRGTEVKALRDGGAQMKDSYALIRDGEVWLLNLHIPPYKPAARENHPPERERKLLLHRREVDRIVGRIKEKGLTIVPTRIYFKGRTAKVELALAKGKDRFDKRASIKDREMKRDLERARSDHYTR
jgi:SsrA-binding protein